MPIFTATPRFVTAVGDLINNVNDVMAGGTQVGSAGIQLARNPGQVGGFYLITEREAMARYGSTAYAGLYQYVQTDGTSTASPAKGQIAFWKNLAAMQAYTVTADAATTTSSRFAGIFLNSITKGNFGWIQVAGLAQVLFGTITKTTPADGDLVVVNQTPLNVADVLADATTLTGPILKTVLGKAVGVPASTLTSAVLLAPQLAY